jgi:hypothetical protein
MCCILFAEEESWLCILVGIPGQHKENDTLHGSCLNSERRALGKNMERRKGKVRKNKEKELNAIWHWNNKWWEKFLYLLCDMDQNVHMYLSKVWLLWRLKTFSINDGRTYIQTHAAHVARTNLRTTIICGTFPRLGMQDLEGYRRPITNVGSVRGAATSRTLGQRS